LLGFAAVRRKATLMAQLATRSRAGVVVPTEGPGSTVGHVLVADGDANSRERRQLQLSAAGFRVSVARTGFEAIVKASCHVPDLILIDDSISDIEPAETGRLITTCPVTAHIPIVRVAAGRKVPARVFAWLRRIVS
jgi:PleD family two-component response regulator